MPAWPIKIIDLVSEHVRTMMKRSARLYSGEQDRKAVRQHPHQLFGPVPSGYQFHMQERVITSGMTMARVDKCHGRQVLLRNGVRVSVVIGQRWPASDPIVKDLYTGVLPPSEQSPRSRDRGVA